MNICWWAYLSRKELDPFGADVTEPPQQTLIPEPVFYNPKFADMPLQIEGGPSAEYEQANADWASLVTATIRTAQERDRAEKLWQSGKRTEAMAILHKNPNLGIEYRALVDGEVVQSGSYFGKDAADFLNGINIAVGAGLLSPVTGASADTIERHHPILQGGANPQNSGETHGGRIPKDNDPCASVTVTDLIYDKVQPYKRAKGETGPKTRWETAEAHIKRRHMNPNPQAPGSYYLGTFNAVKRRNALTFTFGERFDSQGGGNITFVLNLPLMVGLDSRDNYQPTHTNTLIVGPDCKHVKTSFPGRTAF